MTELNKSQAANFQILLDVAKEQGVKDVPRFLAQMWNESSFESDRVGPKGELGIAQLGPGVIKDFKVKNPFDARENATVGAKYYNQLLARVGGDPDRATIAYNWGLRNLKRLDRGEALNLPQDTITYMSRIKRDTPGFTTLFQSVTPAGVVADRATIQAARGGAGNVIRDIADTSPQPEGYGAQWAAQENLQNKPYKEQQRRVNAFLGKVRVGLSADKSTAAIWPQIKVSLVENITNFLNKSRPDPFAVSTEAWAAYKARTNYSGASEAKQKLLRTNFKVGVLTDISRQYPDSGYVLKQLNSELNLRELQVKEQGELVAAEEGRRKLEAAVAAQPQRSFTGNAFASVASGFTKAFTDVPRFAGELAESEALISAADWIDALIPQPDAEFAGSFTGAVLSGIGQVAGLVLPAILSGGATAVAQSGAAAGRVGLALAPRLLLKGATKASTKIFPLLSAASAGGVAGLQDYYKTIEARGEAVDPTRKYLTAAFSAALGTIDVVLPTKIIGGKFSSKIFGELDNRVVRYIANNPYVRGILAGGIVEGTTEAVQKATAELLISRIYEKDVNLGEAIRQSLEEGSVGGVVGGIFGAFLPRKFKPRLGGQTIDQEKVSGLKEEMNAKGAEFDAQASEEFAPEEPIVEPAPEGPVPEEPAVEPAPEEPIVESAPEEPAVEPTPEAPILEEPIVEEPIVEEPIVEEPTPEAPTTEAVVPFEPAPIPPEPIPVEEAPIPPEEIRGISGRARHLFRRNFISRGFFRDFKDLPKLLRKGATRVAGLAEAAEVNAQSNRALNIDVSNTLTVVQQLLSDGKPGKQKGLTEATLLDMDRALRGDEEAFGRLSSEQQEGMRVSSEDLTARRLDLITRVASVRDEIFSRLHPLIQTYLTGKADRAGAPFSDISSIHQELDADIAQLTAILKTEEAFTPEAKLQAEQTIDAINRIRRELQDEFSLVSNWINKNALIETFSVGSGTPGQIAGKTPAGNYIHRAFKFFTDKKFREQRANDTKAREEAAFEIGQELKRARAQGTLDASDAELTAMGRQTIDDWVATGETSPITGSSIPPITALLNRNNLSPVILDFLGEIKNPFVNYAATAQQINNIRTNVIFAESFLRLGQEQKFLFTKPPADGHYKRLEPPRGKGFDVLEGTYVPADIAQGFQDFLGESAAQDWRRWWHMFNYTMKWGLTVGNPPTGIRNIVSNVFMGTVNMTLSPKAIAETFPEVSALLSDKKLFRPVYRDMVARGVVGESTRAETFREMAADAGLMDETASQAATVGVKAEGAALVKQRLLKAKKFLDRMYLFGDDFGKGTAYLVETARRAKARGLPINDPAIKAEAAEIVKNTWPTYSRAARAIRQLRKLPLGAFPTFTAEIIRNANEIRKQIAKDIRDPNPKIRNLGIQRALGVLSLAGVYAAASAISMEALGMNEEEQEILCKTLAFYENCASTLWVGRNEDGTYQKINTAYMDPYAILWKPVTMLLSDRYADTETAMWEATKELFAPFLGPDILPQKISDMIHNPREKVFKESDTEIVKARKRGVYFAEQFLPGFVREAESIVKAISGTRDRRGKLRTTEQAVRHLFGVNDQKHDPLDALYWEPRQFRRQLDDASGRFKDVWQGENRTNPTLGFEEKAQSWNELNQRVVQTWQNLQQVVTAIRQLPANYSEEEIKERLSRQNALGKERTERLLAGEPAEKLQLRTQDIKSYMLRMKQVKPPISPELLTQVEAELYQLQQGINATP